MKPLLICTAIAFVASVLYGTENLALSTAFNGVFLWALFGWWPAKIHEQARERAEWMHRPNVEDLENYQATESPSHEC